MADGGGVATGVTIPPVIIISNWFINVLLASYTLKMVVQLVVWQMLYGGISDLF